MLRYLLNHLSSGEFILLLWAIILLCAFVMSALSQKYLSTHINYENNKYIGYFLGSISANYGFILGFIIVSLWKELYDVRHHIIQEAEYLSLLVYDAAIFPQAIQNEILATVEQYIKVIVNEEWPLMKTGQVSEKSVTIFTKLFEIMSNYKPESNTENIMYYKFITNAEKVIEFRRKRLEYLNSGLVDVLRVMLILGVFIILFLTTLLAGPSKLLRSIAIILVSGMLSFNLGIALLLDYPLAGTISASPDPFRMGILGRFNSTIPASSAKILQ